MDARDAEAVRSSLMCLESWHLASAAIALGLIMEGRLRLTRNAGKRIPKTLPKKLQFKLPTREAQ